VGEIEEGIDEYRYNGCGDGRGTTWKEIFRKNQGMDE
jgi:hypothetical protein